VAASRSSRASTWMGDQFITEGNGCCISLLDGSSVNAPSAAAVLPAPPASGWAAPGC
jgi:hypothetical protein